MPLSTDQRVRLMESAESLVEEERKAAAMAELHDEVFPRAQAIFEEICKVLREKEVAAEVVPLPPQEGTGIIFRVIDVQGRHYVNEDAAIALTAYGESGELLLAVAGEEEAETFEPKDVTEEKLVDAVVRLLEARPTFA